MAVSVSANPFQNKYARLGTGECGTPEPRHFLIGSEFIDAKTLSLAPTPVCPAFLRGQDSLT
jgi:hypothetical protein